MSGHSKWSTIKRKKGANDAKRGQLFTRLTREIVMASRQGGGDLDSNFSLRLAIDKARANNMPKDNIERAIKRGTGENKDEAVFESYTYEGYTSQGVALVIEIVTDNRNRALAGVRHCLTRHGGNLGESGSVAWQFTKNAYFSFPRADQNEDEIFELAINAGADDVGYDEESVEIFGPVESFKQISNQLELAGIYPEEAALRMIPNQEIFLDPDETVKVLRIIEMLEELEDVQQVFSNLNISDEALTQLAVE